MEPSQTPDNLQHVQGPVKCLSCHHVFENMIIHEIGGVLGLMSGDALLTQATMKCARCGWVFYFSMSGNDIDRFTKFLEQLAGKDPDGSPS